MSSEKIWGGEGTSGKGNGQRKARRDEPGMAGGKLLCKLQNTRPVPLVSGHGNGFGVVGPQFHPTPAPTRPLYLSVAHHLESGDTKRSYLTLLWKLQDNARAWAHIIYTDRCWFHFSLPCLEALPDSLALEGSV